MMAMVQDPTELEIVCNQALEMIDQWTKSTGLALAEQKRETALMIK